MAPVYYLTLAIFVVRFFAHRPFLTSDLPDNLAQMLPAFFFLPSIGFKQNVTIPFSWYIGSMMLATLLLFPMVYCWKKTFSRIVAPLIVIIYCTWAMQTYGKLFMLQGEWLGICFPSFIRAVGDMCMGVVSFEVCESLKSTLKDRLTTVGRALLTIANLSMFAIPIYWIITGLKGDLHPYVLLMFGLGVAISFSSLDFTAEGADALHLSPLFAFLGKTSLALYLGQGIVIQNFPEAYALRFRGAFLYFAECLLVALAIYYGSKVVTYLFGKLRHAFANLCLKPLSVEAEQ